MRRSRQTGSAVLPTRDDVLSIRDGRFYLDGQPFAEISFNKFDLFWQLFDQLEAGKTLDEANSMVRAQDKACVNCPRWDSARSASSRCPGGRAVPRRTPIPKNVSSSMRPWTRPLSSVSAAAIRVVWSLGAGTFTDTRLVPGKGWVHGEEHLRELVSNPESRGRQLLYRYIDETVDTLQTPQKPY